MDDLEISGFPQFFPQVWKTLGGNPNWSRSVRARIGVRQTAECNTRAGRRNREWRQFLHPAELTVRRAVRYHRWFARRASGKTVRTRVFTGLTPFPARPRGISSDEAYLSAQQPPTPPHARLSCPHAEQERSHRLEASPGQGPQAVDGLVELTHLRASRYGGQARSRSVTLPDISTRLVQHDGRAIPARPAYPAPDRFSARL